MSRNLDPAPAKKWCVMVYFAADIDLESAAMADLEQMKAAGSSSEVDLLAQINPGGSRAIRRYHLQKDTYLQEDLVPNIDEEGGEIFLNNVNAREDLVDFVQWCADRSDAEHYALILWGHGQGWKADNPDPCFVPGAGNPRKTLAELLQKAPAATSNIAVASVMPLALPTTVLSGEADFLSNTDLRIALDQAKEILGGKKIDILGFDACLMAMGEICCQVNESVNYVIACEDTVPDESWPYDSILKLVVENAGHITPEDFARVVVWKFIFDFGRKRKFVTQSICRIGTDDSASLNNFTAKLEQLVGALIAGMKDPETRWAAMVARSQVQSFYIPDYVDLFDYCRLLALNCRDKTVSDACREVMNALHHTNGNNNGGPAGLVVDHGTYGHSLKCSFGVSVFFPCAGELPSCYAELEFCKRTRWNEFLSVFLLSPAGHSAVFEEEPVIVLESESKGSSEVPADQPPAIPATPPATPTGVATATLTTVTAGGVVLASNGDSVLGSGIGLKTTLGDVIKTTLGDVIKTSHGDPIKKPQLPSWILPSGPKITSKITRGRPDPTAQGKVTQSGNCGCSSND